jgi:hypothetical protein
MEKVIKFWDIIKEANWESDHDYNRIAKEWSKLHIDLFGELTAFIDNKAKQFRDKFVTVWLCDPGLPLSDDAWNDLVYEVIGRGEDFYNSITEEKLHEMVDDDDYHECFSYCTHIPPKTQFDIEYPNKLQEFLDKLNELTDEYHANIYMLENVWVGINIIDKTIKKELEEE